MRMGDPLTEAQKGYDNQRRKERLDTAYLSLVPEASESSLFALVLMNLLFLVVVLGVVVWGMWWLFGQGHG
jgi:hypothetical protein